jgi:DNA-binding CsgD family transcriptional regulator
MRWLWLVCQVAIIRWDWETWRLFCARQVSLARDAGALVALPALLARKEAAEDLYREAIRRLGRTGLRLELARAQLLYGEWLRRQRRKGDARDQLRAAYEVFVSAGAGAFAERTQVELRATGERARKRTAATQGALTAREAHIARLAGQGASNPEIAAQLYISPATVAYNLRKVFATLGITSRGQLASALSAQPGSARPVTPQD